MGHSQLWGPAGERLLIVGLTGGIASGKSEVDRQLELLGAMVIDADDVARRVVEPGTPANAAIAAAFGPGVLDAEGAIDRPALAAVVFSDEEKRGVLNGITHPAIFQEMQRLVAGYAESRTPEQVPAVVLDAALIVDAGVADVFDLLVVVTADEATRIERLEKTRGMSLEEARARIAAQVPDSRRIEISDFSIRNDGTLQNLKENVSKLWAEISRRARDTYS